MTKIDIIKLTKDEADCIKSFFIKFITTLLILLFFSVASFSQSTENNTEQIKKSKVQSITVMGAPLDEYGKASTIRSKKEYRKYNTKGQLVQEIIYNPQSAIISNTSYLYNGDGKIVKRLVKNASSTTQVISKLLVAKIHHQKGILKSKLIKPKASASKNTSGILAKKREAC